MRNSALLLLVLVLGLAVTPATSVSQTVDRTMIATGTQPPIASSLVIEQFLRAVNARDLSAMARLFGTVEGPITKRDPVQNVETRMYALSTILRHEDYKIETADIVPGRMSEATRVTVRMTIAQRMYRVPFTLVRSKGDVWLVEQIGIEEITNRH